MFNCAILQICLKKQSFVAQPVCPVIISLTGRFILKYKCRKI